MKEKWKNDYLQISITTVKDEDGGYTGWINEKHLTGCLAQADTEEQLKKELHISLQCMLEFYHQDSARGRKLSILRYNATKGQFWFTIVGLGLTINWLRRYKDDPIIGITKPGGFRIGKLLIFLHNHWRKMKEVGEKRE